LSNTFLARQHGLSFEQILPQDPYRCANLKMLIRTLAETVPSTFENMCHTEMTAFIANRNLKEALAFHIEGTYEIA